MNFLPEKDTFDVTVSVRGNKVSIVRTVIDSNGCRIQLPKQAVDVSPVRAREIAEELREAADFIAVREF